MIKMFLKGILTILFVGIISSNLFASPITASSDQALNGSTVLDFESLAEGWYSSITVGNLEISSTDTVHDFRLERTYSGQYNVTGNALSNSTGFNLEIIFNFTSEVNAFGFNLGGTDDYWSLAAFDSCGALLESLSVNPNYISNNGDFFGIAHDGISYAVLSADFNTYTSDYILVDNIAYSQTAPVPEPSTILLLGSGLLGLGWYGRKRKKS